MVEDSKIKEIYSQIQKQLFYMIPEKWDKVYLYSSIFTGSSFQVNSLPIIFLIVPLGK